MAVAPVFPLFAIAAATAITPVAAGAQEIIRTDYISQCRSEADDPIAQISCLEAAIQALVAQDGAEMKITTEAMVTARPSVEGLGAEQVLAGLKVEGDDTNLGDEEVEAAVAEFAQTPSGAYVFFLDNGQVWRQKRADSNRIHLSDKRKYTVVVSTGAISGYRLKIHELRRTLLVERIK